MSKTYLVLCSVGFLIIICIYLEPETKLLTVTFSLTLANFGSAISLPIHRIQSFAGDIFGVSAFWQIKSSINPCSERKSRAHQAWCSMVFLWLGGCCYVCLFFVLTCMSLQPAQYLLRWLLRTVEVYVKMLLKMFSFPAFPMLHRQLHL